MRIWNVTNGELAHVLRGHTNWVWAVAFSPDGKRLVSGSSDRTVRVWNPWAAAEPLVLRGHELKVLGVAFSSDVRSITATERSHSG